MNRIKNFFYYYWLPTLSTIIILLITYVVYSETQKKAYLKNQNYFELLSEEAIQTIENRFLDYVQILRSTNAFMASSDSVTREDWRKFIQNLHVQQNYPGIQGLAFSVLVPKGQLEKHIRQIRKDGFETYTITPPGERDVYTSVIYIEPFEGRNLRAFGYDMYTEPVRKKAMDRARDTGTPSVSGKVQLIQETEENVQPGFLLYLPVYKYAAEPQTVEDRRSSLRGFVYCPFRSYDLMNLIIRNRFHKMDIEIYDESFSEKNLLYNKNNVIDYGSHHDESTHIALKNVYIGGRLWRIQFTSLPNFGSQTEEHRATLYLLAGLLISLMCLIITSVISKARKTKIEAERKTRENAVMLQKIFLDAPALVALVRASDECFMLVNTQYQKVFGKEEMLYKPVGKALPELDKQGFFSPLREVIKTGNVYVGKEIPAVTDNHKNEKKTSYFNFVYQPIKNDHKKADMILIFGIEVTEQIKARQELHAVNKKLNQKNTELRKINADLDNFIYTASHDLKAPITNLEGLTLALEDAMDGHTKNPEVHQLMEMIQTSINRFKLTIQDLSDITKIQKNVAEDIEEVSVKEVFEEVRLDYKGMIEEAGASIRFQCSIAVIHFSKANLRSILQNLISNAIKYRSSDRDPVIDIRCSEDSIYFLLEVSDNGLGIKENQKEKIFGMFKRFHTHVEGTGIGLYIVKRIIENYGGKIILDSEEGAGSSFRIYIPKKL